MRPHYKFRIAAAGWIMAFFALAGTSEAETFSLGRVYSRVLQENEEVQIAERNVDLSEQERKRAISAILPRLTLTGTYARSPEKTTTFGVLQPERSTEFQAKVEQPLFAGGKGRAGIRIADGGIRVARATSRLSTEERLLSAAQSYYTVLKARKDLEGQQRNVERLREHRRLSELRFKVGEVTESILLRAEAELASAEADQVARENRLAVSRRELQNLTGLPDDFEVEEPPLPEIPAGTGPSLLSAAMQKREDLQRGKLNEQIAQDRVSFARAFFFPTLVVEGVYFGRQQDPEPAFFVKESWRAEARIEFPIFEGGLRRAELKQAHTGLEQSRLEMARLRKQVELDLSRSLLNIEAVRREQQSRDDQVRFATKNYEMISRQFTFGLVTNLDLLDANQTLIEAERDQIATTFDRHLAILDLQRGAGVFLPQAVKAAEGGQ